MHKACTLLITTGSVACSSPETPTAGSLTSTLGTDPTVRIEAVQGLLERGATIIDPPRRQNRK